MSPFPTGDHKGARNRHGSMARQTYKMHRLGTVSKEIIGDLNRLNGSNLTVNSDMDQKHRYLVCMKDSHLLVHVRFKINIFFSF